MPEENGFEPAPALQAGHFTRAALEPGSGAQAADTTGGAWRVIETPTLSNEPALIFSPLGYLAASARTLGDGKAILGYQSVLYRSTDGVAWEKLFESEANNDLAVRGLAYGRDRYVMTALKLGAEAVFLHSTDGVQWAEVAQGVPSTDQYGALVFVGERFFALGHRYLGVSSDGKQWTHVPITNVQARAVAYGNGKYVLVGSGPIQVSDDGDNWRSVEVPCELPGACITDPSGGVTQGVHSSVVFADGAFYSDQLSSEDGESWQAGFETSPAAYTAGHFLSELSQGLSLQAWEVQGAAQSLHVVRPTAYAHTPAGRAVSSIGLLNAEEPLPATLSVGFDDGLQCDNAHCVVLGSRLLLVPPLEQSPLTDRVPRDALGEALLSDACPVSSQITCDDYAARTGCTCDPEAPTGPEACSDVGKYACAGQFTVQGEEWPLAAQAGCTCDFVQPNQPASFAQTCVLGDNTCVGALECRELLAEASVLPEPSRFVCTAACERDADCPTWQATGFCAGAVSLQCEQGTCQLPTCD